MREAHILFLGCAVSHYTGLALSLNATLSESPGNMKCFCGVRIVILAKLCLLIDFWPKALGIGAAETPPLECF